MTTEEVRLDPPPALDMAIGPAMFTQRAIRRFDHERPIGDEAMKILLDAASKAPSGANTQPARLVVLRDREVVARFGSLYHEAWWAKRRDQFGWEPGHEIPADSPFRMPALLADEMHRAPAIVLAYTRPGVTGAGLSVIPGVQNLMLAARALGIGSVLTTLHPDVTDRVNALVGAPEGADLHCCVPLGYPRGSFGPTRRQPIEDTTFWDGWGQPPPWAAGQ